MANITALQAQRAALIDRIASLVAENQSLARGIQRLETDLVRASTPGALGQIRQAQEKIAQNDAEIARLRAQLLGVERDINQAQQLTQAPKISAGETTVTAQQARDDRANAVVPPGQPPSQLLAPDGRIITTPLTRVPSSAERLESPVTTGTNDPVRPGRVIQSDPPPTARTPIQPGSSSTRPGGVSGVATAPPPTLSAGATAPSDDQTNATRARINEIFDNVSSTITPQPNVLDQYANYTYNISIYILDPADYRRLLAKQFTLPANQLLISTGGAPLGQRNQRFPLDYYIDNVKIKSLITGRGSGSAHNSASLTFTLTEPNGITLIPNLVAATQDLQSAQGGAQTQNYASQNFLMVIKFYGYDANGNLVNVSGSIQQPSGGTGATAVVEKYIPFQFTAIKFRIANQLTEYQCEAVCPQYTIASGAARGVIPYNVELVGITVKDLLLGNLSLSAVNRTQDIGGRENPVPSVASRPGSTVAPTSPDVAASTSSLYGLADTTATTGGGDFFDSAVYLESIRNRNASTTSNTPAPPKASTAPNVSIVSGLQDALNRYQAQLVKDQVFEHPDIYEILLPEEIIANAKLQPPEFAAGLPSTPMSQPATAADAKLGSKQSVNTDAKTVSATAGQSIVQFIDQTVRTSTYIYDQQTKIVITDKNGKQSTVPNGVPANSFAWYRIGLEAEPYRYDNKRKDYAYKIIYSVTPYKVNDIKNDFFPKSTFSGVHKQYQYWFTGQNTDIVEYSQDFNYLYYMVVNSSQAPPVTTNDYRDLDKRAYQPRSNQTTHGAPGIINEPSAAAATVLYSPGDTGRVNLTIMGDPAWLQQGEIRNGVRGLDKFYYGAFLPDGSINYDSQEILFEVIFNQPSDIDLQTGLMKSQP